MVLRQVYRSQDLEGRNFSDANLRGAIFSNSNLKGVNFIDSKTGLPEHIEFIFLCLSLLVIALSGTISQVTLQSILSESTTRPVFLTTILVLSTFFLLVFFNSLVSAIVFSISIAVIAIIVGALSGEISTVLSDSLAGVVVGAIGTSVLGSLIFVVNLAALIVLCLRGRLATYGMITLAFIGIGTTALAQAASLTIISFSIISGIVVLIGINGGKKSFTENYKHDLIKSLVIRLISLFGTNFKDTNLTDADFSGATLKGVNFYRANLTRTCWKNSRDLEFSHVASTYLTNSIIRQLVVTCNGRGQNFDGLDLTGVNLQGANLQDASFIGANLNQSNLRDSDLSRAILKQTQLDGTDLTDAILTGACIEDWGMTNTTKLENVQCDYVYMRLPTPEKRNPLRKPDDERKTFSQGEFADFIKPYFDTLDLYHRQDVDPRSISIALKNLAENHPDVGLQFVAIEWRGNGLNIRYTAVPDVDKSELSHEYFTNYARIRKELLGSIQLRLAAQDAEISRMEGVINKFIQTGTHQSTIQAETIQIIQGEFAMTENRGIHINTGDNANIRGLSSGDGIVNLGTISGNVTNAINQLPNSPEPDQANLKTLLAQLQQVIEIDSDLPDPDKADLLEQVQSLAEAKQVKEPAKREGIARKAMKIFDATLKSLPDTAKIVDACSKLLPLILKALGFPA
ncbi:hypothetical protein C7293_08825 [filamentous cyanobacterium CCT1]|nr:hypothetical protein C7293_08825 [filamentous cyanobacterium CCT1]PSN80380.1 hypothetical protein C8B47_06860 [filamentous cyanobacterium CCP4]